MAVTNQLSLCMPWLRTGTIDCAVPDLVEIGEWPHVLRPKLRDVDWKTCYGKKIRSSKRLSNLQPTDAMGKKHMFFHDVFLLLIPNQANTLFWTFLLMSILSYIGALFGWQPQWGFGFSHSFGGYNLMKVGTTQDGSMWLWPVPATGSPLQSRSRVLRLFDVFSGRPSIKNIHHMIHQGWNWWNKSLWNREAFLSTEFCENDESYGSTESQNICFFGRNGKNVASKRNWKTDVWRNLCGWSTNMLGTEASEYFRGLDNSAFTLVQLFTFDSNLWKSMGS